MYHDVHGVHGVWRNDLMIVSIIWDMGLPAACEGHGVKNDGNAWCAFSTSASELGSDPLIRYPWFYWWDAREAKGFAIRFLISPARGGSGRIVILEKILS